MPLALNPRKRPSGSRIAVKAASSSSGNGPRTTMGGPTLTLRQSAHISDAGVATAMLAMNMSANGPAARDGTIPLIRSIRVFRVEQPERGHEQDVEVEQDGPVFDIVEVVVHPLHDLFDRVGLAPPAVDLCPAGHARFDAMTGKIAFHGFVIELV